MATSEIKEVIQNELQESFEVVTVQACAIVDHICPCRDEDALHALVPSGELGGSQRASKEEIRDMLANSGDFFSKAGGSSSNMARGLAGFGIRVKVVGVRGGDEWGALYNGSLRRAGVNMDRVVSRADGTTGRSCIVTYGAQRTMRTCLDGAARLTKDDVGIGDFMGAKYVFLSCYLLYSEGLLERCIDLALVSGCRIALDLASFEIVRAFKHEIKEILKSKSITLCFCNEDEAIEVVVSFSDAEKPGHDVLDFGGKLTAEAGLAYLAKYCSIAVVTLGERGCLVLAEHDDVEITNKSIQDKAIYEPACPQVKVVDTTGAGDLFAAGFLYSLLRGYSMRRAAQIGCMTGGAVVQTLGGEMSEENWEWLHQRMHGDLAAETVRSSAIAVQRELLDCYSLIERKGRGVVYYGSARLREESCYWEMAKKLGAAVANLLGVTTWSGGGPGMMQAATLGAIEEGGNVAGIRIAREAGTTVRSASYLPDESSITCRFLSSRKVALVDAGVRAKETEMTAFIFLPGGLGTMDEFFELLTLVQLRKLGTKHPVPLLLCNFETSDGKGFYDGLLDFLGRCHSQGVIGTFELQELLVASNINDVLQALSDFYGLELPKGIQRNTMNIARGSDWFEMKTKTST